MMMKRQSGFAALVLAAALAGLTGCQGRMPAMQPMAATPMIAPQAKPVSAASNSRMAIEITVALRPTFLNENIDVQQVASCDSGTTYAFFAVVGNRTVHGTYYPQHKKVALANGAGNMQLAIKITVDLRTPFPHDSIDVDYVSDCTSDGLYAFSAKVGSRRVNGLYDARNRQVLI